MQLNIIGFSRYITLDWLNETARLTKELKDPDQVKQVLQQIINGHEGEEAKRKTIDVLTRAWTRVDENHIWLRDEALKLFEKSNSREKTFLHWGILTLAYPIFHDVTETIGRLSNLQGSVTINQVNRSIKKGWGDRTTLNRTVGRIIQSLTSWGIVAGDNGSLQINKKISTFNIELEKWLLMTIMQYRKPKLISYNDLIAYPALFPFSLEITLSQLRDSPRIEIINQGSNISLLKIK